MATGFGAMITRERLGERSSRFKAAVGMAAWKTLELRSHEFHRSVAVVTLSEGDTRSEDIFLELAQFHDHIYTIDCYRWLDIHGTHRIRGCERVLQLGSQLFPGVHLKWILGERFKDETSGLAGRVDIPSRLTMVNIPWLTAYLLLVAVEGKAIKTHDPASRAKELLQLMTSLPAFELEAPCTGGSLVINRHGVSGSMNDKNFLSAMADACQDAECRSPVPGPLEKVTTWVLLTQLAWKIEQWVFMPLQSQVLQVVLEWCGLLLAWLCVGVYEWCKRQDEPSTHSLLATKAPGRGGAGRLGRSLWQSGPSSKVRR